MIIKTKYAIAFLYICALLWGCNTRNNSNNVEKVETVTVDSMRIERQFFNPVDTTILWCEVKAVIEYPIAYKDSDALAQLNKLIATLLFGEMYSSYPSLPIVADTVTTRRFDELCAERVELNEETTFPIESSFGAETKANILYNERNFLTYHLYQYIYTGGAHGMYANNYHVIYLPTLTPLTLSEMIKPEYIEELNHLLVEKLTDNLGMASSDELVNIGYFDHEGITATDNFYIDNNGITWVYNPYEIGCYAIGETSITLTYDEVSYFIAENSPVQTLLNNKQK